MRWRIAGWTREHIVNRSVLSVLSHRPQEPDFLGLTPRSLMLFKHAIVFLQQANYEEDCGSIRREMVVIRSHSGQVVSVEILSPHQNFTRFGTAFFRWCERYQLLTFLIYHVHGELVEPRPSL
jgi:hypothetical protein